MAYCHFKLDVSHIACMDEFRQLLFVVIMWVPGTSTCHWLVSSTKAHNILWCLDGKLGRSAPGTAVPMTWPPRRRGYRCGGRNLRVVRPLQGFYYTICALPAAVRIVPWRRRKPTYADENILCTWCRHYRAEERDGRTQPFSFPLIMRTYRGCGQNHVHQNL